MAIHEYNYEKEPTVSIVKDILVNAVKMKASDIHFDPHAHNLTVKFRINGDLTEYTTAPDSAKTNILTRIKILAGMNITESVMPQIGAIKFEYNGKPHSMRVSTIPVIDGEKIVVHLSNYALNLKDLKSLGMTKENLQKIQDMLKENSGIILITGTNASGKTTTMYSLLKELSTKPLNIISIEDPIKMKIDNINQVQINPEKGLTYHNIIKTALLSDPNVIALNELINDETTRSALRASVTGRLVISTMNTKTIFTTIKTLLNMEVENYLLGSNLIGIISQRLVKRLCPSCRKKKAASSYEQKVLKYVLKEDINEIFIPNGCEECHDGYIDQMPIAEVVKISEELRQAIANNRDPELIRKIIYEENNSIIIDCCQKVKDGETSFEELMRIIDIKTDLFNEDKELKAILLGNEDKDEISSVDEITTNEEPNIIEEALKLLDNASTKNNHSKDADSSNSTKTISEKKEDTKPISKEDLSNQESNKKKKNVNDEVTTDAPKKDKKATLLISNDVDNDDDDDDFNYDDGYINNF